MNNINFNTNHICIEEILKRSKSETTQKIYIDKQDLNRVGPFIRKIINFKEIGIVYRILYNDDPKLNIPKSIPQILYFESADDKTIVVEQYFDGLTLDKYMMQNEYNIKTVECIANVKWKMAQILKSSIWKMAHF